MSKRKKFKKAIRSLNPERVLHIENQKVNYPSLKEGACVGSQLLKQVKQLH